MRTPKRRTEIRDFEPKEISDAKRLYFQYGTYPPMQLKLIEREMRGLGWAKFNRTDLQGDGIRGEIGLIAEFGWEQIRQGKEIEARTKAMLKRGFRKWLETRFPEWKWHWRYQRFIFKNLEAMRKSQVRRLMIFVPPRHGKSELVTIRYSAWRLEMDPKLRIIIGSHSQKLANRFSRQIRRINQYVPSQTVGENVERAGKILNTADEWETYAGGGVKAVGVGAGVTGFGADLIIIDDPTKSRADAESANNRERIWDWFSDDLHTRLEPKGTIILIQTRWHEDDLAGRLIKKLPLGGEQWRIVTLPALAEADDPLKRKEGKALCPKRFDEKTLDSKRRQMGSYSFAALYQQRPVPLDGGLFKRSWFRRIVEAPPPGLSWARGYDLAISTRESADYTASFRCAFDADGNLYIADGFRRRIEYPQQRRYVIEKMKTESSTSHGIEKALHGQALVQDLRRDSRAMGGALMSVGVDSDKFTRALTWAGLAEEGKVILIQGSWIDDFLEEACQFPDSGHDDQIDAVSLAVRMLKRRNGKLHTFK